ncbi:hypothetical protein [Burkholderia arboris]|uniref:hypothetical protein n=1 Tax=Burkholderia arboris TaxID=488730 RepID=UPI0030F1D9AA
MKISSRDRRQRSAQASLLQHKSHTTSNLPPLTFSKSQGIFIRDLVKSDAHFLVVGGKAMQAIGIERKTMDLDVWISRNARTAESVFSALKKLCGAPDVFRERLCEPNIRVAIPNEQHPEIDVLTSIGDLSFEEMYSAATEVTWRTYLLRIPKRDDLIRIKQVTITSIEGRIAAGQWNAASIEEARRVIIRDQRDIELILQR